MPRNDFQDLAAAQRETARVLGLLASRIGKRTAREDGGGVRAEIPAATGGREAALPRLPLGGGSAAASRPREELARIVERVVGRAGVDRESSGELPGTDRSQQDGVENALRSTARSIGELQASLTANTRALEETGLALTRGLGGVLSQLLQGGNKRGGFSGLFRGGFGLASVGLKVAGLFRGNERQEASFEPFQLPGPASLEVANPDNILRGFQRVDRGQRGEVRTRSPSAQPSAQPQVVVNISAMDSKSFMDRSDDIARAMRDAMLHMHPVNDVISEI